MSKKRVYYKIDRQMLSKAIEMYEQYEEKYEELSGDDYRRDKLWEEFYDTIQNICKSSYCYIALSSLMQAMHFSDTLTEENLYMTIIAAGINTETKEVDDD